MLATYTVVCQACLIATWILRLGDPLVTHNNLYTAISRKVVGKNVHATTPKGNMGYDQYTVPNDCGCRTYFCCFPLAFANIIMSVASPAILSNFFGEQGRQNHPQYLSGLSHGLFATTFLKTAVCKIRKLASRNAINYNVSSNCTYQYQHHVLLVCFLLQLHWWY